LHAGDKRGNHRIMQKLAKKNKLSVKDRLRQKAGVYMHLGIKVEGYNIHIIIMLYVMLILDPRRLTAPEGRNRQRRE